MSTTTTRQAYRRTGTRWQGEPIAIESECTCGQRFADLGDLMGHECPDSFRANGTNPATSKGDSLDVPEYRGGAAGYAAPPVMATEPQVRYLIRLGVDADEAAEMTKRQASEAIDRKLAEAKADEKAQPRAASDCRPNRFAGPCRFCGGNVPAEQGLLCRLDGRWAVEHKAGGCQPASGHTAAPEATPAAVAAGHYAIPSTGSNDLAFYRVDHGEGRWAGRTFVKLVVGGHPEQNMPRSHVPGILARIAADPDAGPRYGREIGRCCVCNRELTDDESRAAGIGPKCAQGGRD